MMKRFFLIGMVVLLGWSAQTAWAANDTFTIGVTIGNDTTPPTTPTNVQATPASTSQIDVTWNPSTDNQQLAGYKIYRDGVQIANTQLTSFSDTGLTASTTYTYYIRAFDTFNNTSSSSLSVSTTTLALPVVATSTPYTGTTTKSRPGGQVLIRLDSLHVTTATTGATIAWTTSGFAESVLRWGAGSPYDLGYVQDQSLRRDHVTHITGLQPGATYQYEITAINALGHSFTLKQGSFKTVGLTAVTPLNVSDLTAAVQNNNVQLSWHNPVSTDIAKIRVVRSYLFYPTDTSNGAIVYEGKGESFLDKEALANHREQFYTVFVYDNDGNVSSGSIVLARRSGSAQTPVLNERPVATTGGGGSSATTTGAAATTTPTNTNAVAVKPNIATTFGDFSIVQDGVTIHPSGTTFTITNAVPILVQVPYDKVPEHLKSIIMTIDGKTSYLMRVSKDAKTYQAYIPAITLGKHSIEFAIYDFQTSSLKKLDGSLIVNPVPLTPLPWWVPILAAIQPYTYWLIGGGVSILALTIAYLLLRFDVRRR